MEPSSSRLRKRKVVECTKEGLQGTLKRSAPISGCWKLRGRGVEEGSNPNWDKTCALMESFRCLRSHCRTFRLISSPKMPCGSLHIGIHPNTTSRGGFFLRSTNQTCIPVAHVPQDVWGNRDGVVGETALSRWAGSTQRGKCFQEISHVVSCLLLRRDEKHLTTPSTRKQRVKSAD